VHQNTMEASSRQQYTNIDWCRGQHWKIMPRSCVMLHGMTSSVLLVMLTGNVDR